MRKRNERMRSRFSKRYRSKEEEGRDQEGREGKK
jgi:hypothetical protein